MANPLTGDYDVVVEIAVGAIDRILATAHQQSASEAASPQFPYSLTARVGDRPKIVQFELAEAMLEEYFGHGKVDIGSLSDDVLAELQDQVAVAKTTRRKLADIADPSAATGPLVGAIENLASLSVVRGLARIQLGTPTLALTPGSSTKLSVRAQIRAAYYPDPGTNELPKPIHGEVLATFLPTYNASGADGKPALEVKPAAAGVAFTPAQGTSLTASEAKRIAREVQRFVDSKFGPSSVKLPDKFPFREFTSIVGTHSAIALPVKLSSVIFPPSVISVGELFLAPTDDFAIAIGKDYIGTMLQPVLAQIEQLRVGYDLTDAVFGITWASFSAWVSNVTLEWLPDELKLVVTGAGHLWKAVGSDEDYNFTITQYFGLSLDIGKQAISLHAIGGPALAGNLPQEAADYANSEIPKYLGPALDGANNAIKQAQSALPSLSGALAPFDAGASARYTRVEIAFDCIILHGSVTASSRPAVAMDFAPTPDGTGLDAFNSWIPAGTIDRFVWNWVTPNPANPLPWAGIVHEVKEPHEFILRWSAKPGQKPWEVQPPPWKLYRMCLSIEGTQTGSISGIADVSGGTCCAVGVPEWLFILPAWWAKVLAVPIWGPDPGEAALDGAIVAHLNVRAEVAPAAAVRSSALIHFADGSAPPLPALSEALRRSKHAQAAVPVIVVMPRGSFAQTRSVVERSLGAFAPDLEVPLAITEDYDASWSGAFGVAGAPATYLMSAGGEVAWNHRGQPDTAALAAALNEHVTAATRRRSRPPRAAVRIGAMAPELPPDHARPHARRLGGGKRCLLLFWKSWSMPCINELVRLGTMHDRAGEQGPAILAIGDGEDTRSIEQVARAHHLRLPLVADPNREIARRYGINCWPAIVSVRHDGLIDRIHYGAVHGGLRQRLETTPRAVGT